MEIHSDSSEIKKNWRTGMTSIIRTRFKRKARPRNNLKIRAASTPRRQPAFRLKRFGIFY